MIRSRGAGVTTTALSGPIGMHMVTHERARRGGRRLPPASGPTVGPRIGGFAVADLRRINGGLEVEQR